MSIEYSWQSTPQLWAAMRPDYDGAIDAKHPIGFGKTKEEAAADLLEHEQDIADRKQWPVTECRCIHGMGGRCTHCDPRMTNANS